MRTDFVKVRLTAKGEEVAQGRLVVAGGKYEFTFEPGVELEVTAGEWREILSKEERDGAPLLEAIEEE